jgi:hypothetical protein
MDDTIATRQSVAVMKRILGFVLLLGCQHGEEDHSAARAPVVVPEPAAPVEVATATPYAGDIQRICNSMHLSGADKDPGGAQVVVANWLAGHIETSQAHDFLVEISPLVGVPKADRLESEAKKVGLPGCALAAAWR